MVKPSPTNLNRYAPVQSVIKLIFLCSNFTKLAATHPVNYSLIGAAFSAAKRDGAASVAGESQLTAEEYWVYLFISAVLVLTGGVFAGLTLALMGQDEVYLKVISTSGEPSERQNAEKVLKLLDRGKHWVLVTLLLSNVITNETLPIVLDRVLGGGWPAVVSSTVAIVIFGEVIPQSVCVRYGLQIGAFFTPFVLGLMVLMYPIAYPISVLLDKILGEDHGTIYKKKGLKTLVTLHRSMGVDRLNDDEVTIISAVLDLKEKSVSKIMTPMRNVYTMSSDAILDEQCVESIFNSGFSRIPIHVPNEPTNFIGMLLVRVLISYDPEDALPVSSFPLATLPETPPSTSCLNILNYFQEGKSHMVVVSEKPGESEGTLGVVTLEDVIEELIGEEIVDESDVFIDINKAIKREQPGPLSKKHLNQYLHSLYTNSNRNSMEGTKALSPTPSRMNFFQNQFQEQAGLIHFKPSNPASNPLDTKNTAVTIKRQQPILSTHLKYDYFDDPDQQASQKLLVNDSTPLSREETPEYGALDDVNAHQKTILHYKKSNLDVGRPISSSIKAGNGRQISSADSSDSPYLSGSVVKSMEVRNYRTGGIIESVVNVQGVHKTIIQSTNDNSLLHDCEHEEC
ncbi:hypothetical protein WICPIJ_000731 [Wickerhamomyces pijperi]|uniref:CNNM transmembrane domain-containing protein n=1 Tax=Wickerhamomyces pijperi TaxID=599730 RepID=A0A9P8QF59_WICPI|nr:hypothetical protein WICPIJ_000731 [Wickerhamomyces pijperi]